MKKLIAPLAAGIMAAAALTTSVVASAPAQAAPARCGYTGCVKTVTSASGFTRIEQRGRPNISYRVKAVGNAVPKGFVKVVVKSDSGDYYRAWVMDFDGKRGFIEGHMIPKIDRYTIKARYIPDSHSAFYGSDDSYRLKVVKKKK